MGRTGSLAAAGAGTSSALRTVRAKDAVVQTKTLAAVLQQGREIDGVKDSEHVSMGHSEIN